LNPVEALIALVVLGLADICITCGNFNLANFAEPHIICDKPQEAEQAKTMLEWLVDKKPLSFFKDKAAYDSYVQTHATKLTSVFFSLTATRTYMLDLIISEEDNYHDYVKMCQFLIQCNSKFTNTQIVNAIKQAPS